MIFLLIIFLAVSVQAQTGDLNFSKMNYGTPFTYYSARTLGMGSAGMASADPVSAARINPALLTKTANTLEAAVLGGLYKNEEDRSFPYYDNFGGFVDYGSFVFNDNWYGDVSASIVTDIGENVLPGLFAGISVNPFMDYTYDYVEEVRTTGFSDNVLAFNKIRSEGTLQSYNLSLAYRAMPGLSLGVNVGLIAGEVNQLAAIDSMDASMFNIRQREEAVMELNNTPLDVSLGALYRVDEFLQLAARVQLPLTLEQDIRYTLLTQNTGLNRLLDVPGASVTNFTAGNNGYDSSSVANYSRTLDYPLSLGFGIEYRFTNALQAKVSADFEYTYWSKFEDDLQPDLNYSDTYSIRIGIEHIFFDKVPFRAGFRYEPLRENREFTRSLFTVGTGMWFDHFRLDLSGAISSLTFNQRDMFDNSVYPPLVTRTDILDRVKTTDIFTALEVKYFFDKK